MTPGTRHHLHVIRFKLKRGEPKGDSLQHGRPQPKVKELQKFIDYYIHRSPLNRGPKKDLPTTHTMAQIFRSFYCAY